MSLSLQRCLIDIVYANVQTWASEVHRVCVTDNQKNGKNPIKTTNTLFSSTGQFLCDLNQYERAADIYSEAVDSLPTSFELAFNYANVLRLAKRFEQAERYYKLAVDLKPNDLSARLNCGAILHLNGKLTEAERHYLVALELNPNDAIARSNLEKLRNLKNDPRSMKSNTLNG